MQVACPGCDRKLNVPLSAVGRSVTCPACKGSVKVDESLLPEEEDEEDDADRGSGRRGKRGGRGGRRGKGKKGKKGKKRIDLMPILLVGLLVAAGIGVALYFPMQKRTLRNAIGGGGQLGFNAAHAMARSPGEIANLCSIVETSPTGRMAAAGALALIARKAAPDMVVGTIQERLKESLPAGAKAAYAAALAQSRRKAGEEVAADLVTDGNAPVRLAVVRGLAHGKTDAAARAVGRALGDADEEVLDAAKGAIADWSITDVDKAIAAAAVALELESDQARIAAARTMAALAGDL
ncbi:MAG: zinc ribbon domain-containing protein, partial [Planctomycetota bacterium]